MTKVTGFIASNKGFWPNNFVSRLGYVNEDCVVTDPDVEISEERLEVVMKNVLTDDEIEIIKLYFDGRAIFKIAEQKEMTLDDTVKAIKDALQKMADPKLLNEFMVMPMSAVLNLTGSYPEKANFPIVLLTPGEKEILTLAARMLKMFNCRVVHVRREGDFTRDGYIAIKYISEDGTKGELCTPHFDRTSMFRNMKVATSYTLKELGVDDV